MVTIAPPNGALRPKKHTKTGISTEEKSVSRIKSELRKHRRVLDHDDKTHKLPADVRQELERAVKALTVRLETLAAKAIEVEKTREVKVEKKRKDPYASVKFFGEFVWWASSRIAVADAKYRAQEGTAGIEEG